MEALDAGRLDLDAALDQVKAGLAEHETVMRVVGELLQAGEAGAIRYRAAGVGFHIEDDALRIDLKRRLVTVLRIISLSLHHDFR